MLVEERTLCPLPFSIYYPRDYVAGETCVEELGKSTREQIGELIIIPLVYTSQSCEGLCSCFNLDDRMFGMKSGLFPRAGISLFFSYLFSQLFCLCNIHLLKRKGFEPVR